MQDLKDLGITEDDLEGADAQALEHVVWFTASDTIHEEDNEKAEEQIEKISYFTYKAFIEKNFHNIIKTLLLAHFHEELEKPLFPLQEDIISTVAEIYKNSFMDETPTIEEPKIVSILEAHHVFKEFEDEAESYDDNPVLFLLDDMEPAIESSLLEEAQFFSDEQIIYLFSQFCDYNPSYQDAILQSPDKIDVKKLISILEKLV